MKTSSVIARENIGDRVRKILLDRILDARYPPGHRLVELDIARELGVSQGPVREALGQLEALRLVESAPYRGTRVRDVGEREMREAHEVRAVLEQFAAQLAAPRLRVSSEALRAEVAQMDRAADAGDLERFAHNDLAFHQIIVDAADNQSLRRTWEALGVEMRIRQLLSRGAFDLRAVTSVHLPIVDAFEAGDGAEAGRLLRMHPEIVRRLRSAGPEAVMNSDTEQ
jgi:DNA-binding GntR family transcriptional regulator